MWNQRTGISEQRSEKRYRKLGAGPKDQGPETRE